MHALGGGRSGGHGKAETVGSHFALPAFVIFIPFFVFRLLKEEKILCHELPGYPQCCLRTRIRLTLYLW